LQKKNAIGYFLPSKPCLYSRTTPQNVTHFAHIPQILAKNLRQHPFDPLLQKQ
jgi:hypothetical protein